MIKLICKICSESFEVFPYRKNNAKYCSKNCANKALIGHSFNKGFKRTPEHKQKYRMAALKDGRKPPSRKGIKDSEATRKLKSIAKTGSKNSMWKGGRYTDERGYIVVYCPGHPRPKKGNYVYEHTLVMEKMLGRYLTSKEIVHHRNGIKNDNRPKNLMGFVSNSAHGRFHQNPNNVKSEEIFFDGCKFV